MDHCVLVPCINFVLSFVFVVLTHLQRECFLPLPSKSEVKRARLLHLNTNAQSSYRTL